MLGMQERSMVNPKANAFYAEQALVDLGKQLDAAADTLTETKTTLAGIEKRERDVLSTFKNEFKKKSVGKTSDTQLERQARSCSEWGHYIDGLIAAKQEEIAAKITWDKINIKIDIYRTLLSFNKAQMNLI